MDFAKKQLEKYGWKEGAGLGKEGNEGINKAIKPHYKQGKAGMGFQLGKELTDTWWTRSYADSLKRVNVDSNSNIVTVSTVNDGDDKDTPLVQMRKRMMRSNFTDFSKGGTLNQGKLVPEFDHSSSSSDDDNDDDGRPLAKISKLTNDEDLLKACGGRTAHKAARFGHNLSGKLARLAAQDAYLIAHPEKLMPKEKRKKKKNLQESNTVDNNSKSKSSEDCEQLIL